MSTMNCRFLKKNFIIDISLKYAFFTRLPNIPHPIVSIVCVIWTFIGMTTL